MCHVVAVGAAVLALGGVSTACAPSRGWVREDRVCQPSDPPRVCFDADPDAPLTLRVGGQELVPQECAHAPKARTASLRVELVDGRSGETLTRRITVGKGRSATVRAVETVDGVVFDADRERCGRSR